ncbi:hypothetical protein LIER_20400 [Lithospermum erythrorhizon]|uniref:Uncharacterized protein n=1 Tax=Lithospermum erythrorhizon TaxID=34254 RepID=A0AAV3QLB2_LITER
MHGTSRPCLRGTVERATHECCRVGRENNSNAVWAGCPSLLRSVRLWITRTNVVEWNSKRVTRSTVPRCQVQVVMITPGYALAPLTVTPEPANARENPGRSVLHSSDLRCG